MFWRSTKPREKYRLGGCVTAERVSTVSRAVARNVGCSAGFCASARWRRRLETAPPPACAALYALWTREADGACEPLLEVFAPDERGAVLERLRRGRDRVARAVFRKLCRRLWRRSRRRLL